MSLMEEVGARLTLKDRPKFSSEVHKVVKDIAEIGNETSHVETKSRGAFSRLGSIVGGFGKAVVRAGAVVGTAVGVGMVGAFAEGVREATGLQKILAVTNSTIKATGGVANVTATDVRALANHMEDYTAFNDEAIQSGENLLLTFRNIRNETGKGNAIFDRATHMAANMSTVLGKDLTLSNRILGRALNDPIHGMTMLSRVGISFTDAQKKSIKHLVNHGHLLQAQKYILQELSGRFGGAAKAVGETFGGSLDRLRNKLGDLTRDFALPIMGLFTKGVDKATEYLPKLQHGLGMVTHFLHDLFNGAHEGGAATTELADRVKGVVGPIRHGLGRALDWVNGIIHKNFIPLFHQASAVVRKDLIPAGIHLWHFLMSLKPELKNTAHIAGGLLGGAFKLIGWTLSHVVGPVLLAVTGFIDKHKTAIKAVAFAVGAFILVLKIQKALMVAATVVQGIYTAVTEGGAAATNLMAGAQMLLNLALEANPIGIIIALLVGLVVGLMEAWKHSETFRNIVMGAFHGVETAAKAVWNWLKSNWPYLLGILTGPFGLAAAFIYKHWDGITSWFSKLPDRLHALNKDIMNALLWPFRQAFNLIAKLWNSTVGKVHFSVPGWVPHFGGDGWGFPQMPTLSKLHEGGTLTSPGLVNIMPGEEVVYLPQAASVVPLEAAAKPGDGGGTKVIQLVVDRKVLAQTVYDETSDRAARL